MTTDIRAALLLGIAQQIHAGRIAPHEDGWNETSDRVRECCTFDADAALTALSAKLAELGLRIVPVEATKEMLTAMAKAEEQSAIHNYGALPCGEDAYAVMLAAFPDPLAQEPTAND